MSSGEPSHKDDELLAPLAELLREDISLSVAEKVLARRAERRATGARTPSRAWRPVFWMALAPVAVALFFVARSLHPHVATSEAVQTRDRIMVVGPESLVPVGEGPVRLFVTGEAIPLGVAVRPIGAVAGAELQFADRSRIRLDAGAVVSPIDASQRGDSLTLVDGRIAVDTGAASQHLRVRLPTGTEVTAHAAQFGVLVAEGDRWSAVIEQGEVDVRTATATVHAAAPSQIGGRGGILIGPRPIPPSLVVEARTRGAEQRWILEGLSDSLARVELAGRQLEVDEQGRFRLVGEGALSGSALVVADAAGRRVERSIRLEAAGAHGIEPRSKPASKDARRQEGGNALRVQPGMSSTRSASGSNSPVPPAFQSDLKPPPSDRVVPSMEIIPPQW